MVTLTPTSLVQTIGRAARNVNGRVIMYADRISDAMEEAISETQERRAIQMAYNKEHNITPKSIVKAVEDILEREKAEAVEDEKQDIRIRKSGYNLLDSSQRRKYIKELEAEMLQAAKDLEFERAAVLRDEINDIKSMKFDS